MNAPQVLGTLLFLYVVLQIITGSLLNIHGGSVTRQNRPVIFWAIIVLEIIVAGIFWFQTGNH